MLCSPLFVLFFFLGGPGDCQLLIRVLESERESERQTDRETERQKERQRSGETIEENNERD